MPKHYVNYSRIDNLKLRNTLFALLELKAACQQLNNNNNNNNKSCSPSEFTVDLFSNTAAQQSEI